MLTNRYKVTRGRYYHRIIMEVHLGRKLKISELVHHKNNNVLDNRIKNLEIISRAEHASLHHKGRKRTEFWKKRIGESNKKINAKRSKKERELINKKISQSCKGRIAWNKGLHRLDKD